MSFPQNQAPRGKTLGVGTSQSQSGTREERSTGKKNVLVSFAPGRMYAVQYTNDEGLLQDPLVVFEAGGIFYMPQAAQQWSKELRPLADWLQKDLRNKVAQLETRAKAEVPKEDGVDILGADNG